MALTDLFFAVPTVYGIIIFFNYTVVSLIIYKDKALRRQKFYRLFIIGYFMNCITYINSFITLRIPLYTQSDGWFAQILFSKDDNDSERSTLLMICFSLHYIFACTQYLFTLTICWHRFTILQNMNGTRNDNWEKWSYWVLAAVVCIVGVVGVLVFHFRAFYRFNSKGNFFHIDSTINRLWIYIPLVIMHLLMTLGNLGLNYFLLQKTRSMRSSLSKTGDKLLYGLLISTFLIDSFLTTLTCFNTFNASRAYYYNTQQTPQPWILFLTPFASDALTLTPPIILLIVNKPIRVKVVEYVPFLKPLQRFQVFANSAVLPVVEITGVLPALVPQKLFTASNSFC